MTHWGWYAVKQNHTKPNQTKEKSHRDVVANVQDCDCNDMGKVRALL